MMYRLLAIAVFLSLSHMAHGDSDPPPATAMATLHVNLRVDSLYLTLEVPASAAILLDSKTATVANKIEQLTGALKYTRHIFSFPAKAACSRRHIEVVPSKGEPGVIANWEFQCKRPDLLDSIGTRIFSLMNLHSIVAVILPHGQASLLPSQPLLRLDQDGLRLNPGAIPLDPNALPLD
jgi:hypothetical protein